MSIQAHCLIPHQISFSVTNLILKYEIMGWHSVMWHYWLCDWSSLFRKYWPYNTLKYGRNCIHHDNQIPHSNTNTSFSREDLQDCSIDICGRGAPGLRLKSKWEKQHSKYKSNTFLLVKGSVQSVLPENNLSEWQRGFIYRLYCTRGELEQTRNDIGFEEKK